MKVCACPTRQPDQLAVIDYGALEPREVALVCGACLGEVTADALRRWEDIEEIAA